MLKFWLNQMIRNVWILAEEAEKNWLDFESEILTRLLASYDPIQSLSSSHLMIV